MYTYSTVQWVHSTQNYVCNVQYYISSFTRVSSLCHRIASHHVSKQRCSDEKHHRLLNRGLVRWEIGDCKTVMHKYYTSCTFTGTESSSFSRLSCLDLTCQYPSTRNEGWSCLLPQGTCSCKRWAPAPRIASRRGKEKSHTRGEKSSPTWKLREAELRRWMEARRTIDSTTRPVQKHRTMKRMGRQAGRQASEFWFWFTLHSMTRWGCTGTGTIQ